MNDRRVVITGTGIVSCVGNSVVEFWDSLVNGRCGLGQITRFDVSEYRTRIGGEVKNFDISRYMPVKDAKRLDLFCQFAVAAADEAMLKPGFRCSLTAAGLTAPESACLFPAESADLKF